MEPAIGLLELASIAAGIRVGDAMVKRAPVDMIFAGTVHPGKYLVLVAGQVADVEEALAAGDEVSGTRLDRLFLPDAHPGVAAALQGSRTIGTPGEAIGIVETATVAATLGAADRGLKAADVALRDIHLADELGGKAYCLFQGFLADIEEAVDAAVDGLAHPDLLVERVIIPQIHDEMLENLDAAPTFLRRVRPGAPR